MTKDNAQLAVLLTIMTGVLSLVYMLHLVVLWLASQTNDGEMAIRAIDNNNTYHDAVAKLTAQLQEDTHDTD